MKALYGKLRSWLDGGKKLRHRPIHGAHGRPRDVEYVFARRRYRASRARHYLVHLPPAYRRGRRLPVVMILHGCDQDHRQIQQVSDFDRVADEHGIIVVYPFVTSYDGPRLANCWGFWNSTHNQSGAGEVEDLWAILTEVRARYGADPNRLHVAGLSSGASMAVALLVTRCNRIASGAEIAGLAYTETPLALGCVRPQYKSTTEIVAAMDREMGRKKRLAPLMIVHATGDRVVSVRAAERLRDSWAESFAVDAARPSWSASGNTSGTPWQHRRYVDTAGQCAIETLLLDHDHHGWYGGAGGRYGFADAPDVSAKIWRFFEANTLNSATVIQRVRTKILNACRRRPSLP
jgi:poly(hydroxyalkanoate) depolymerase family esterase